MDPPRAKRPRRATARYAQATMGSDQSKWTPTCHRLGTAVCKGQLSPLPCTQTASSKPVYISSDQSKPLDQAVQGRLPCCKTPIMSMADSWWTDSPTNFDGASQAQSPHQPLSEQHNNPAEDLTMAGPLLEVKAAFQPGKSRLELLPDELLTMVLKELAPADYTVLDTDAYRANQRNLRSLCLVSKKMEMFARPELYRDVRLYRNSAVLHFYAALFSDPSLAAHVRSILLNPLELRYIKRQIWVIDFAPLHPIPDADYAFWTTSKGKSERNMPRRTSEQLICTLFCKALSRLPALESLYFKVPKLTTVEPNCLKRLPRNTKFTEQLQLHEHLFEEFCQGNTLPNLPTLKTVGILDHVPRDYAEWVCAELFRKLFRMPHLRAVTWACSDGKRWRDVPMDWGIWSLTLDNIQTPSIGAHTSTFVQNLPKSKL